MSDLFFVLISGIKIHVRVQEKSKNKVLHRLIWLDLLVQKSNACQ